MTGIPVVISPNNIGLPVVVTGGSATSDDTGWGDYVDTEYTKRSKGSNNG